MNYKFYSLIESYLFYKISPLHKIISFLLLPFSYLYGFIALIKRLFSIKKDFKIPIISIGNLSLGGNGKTPLAIKIANSINKKVCIILRGYNRKTDSLLQVSSNGNILCKTKECGDEAMLIAKEVPLSSVIVSANRQEAILLAKKLNVDFILLDDAFSKSNIKKLDILIEPNKKDKINTRVIPSGSYREFRFSKIFADLVIYEEIDFQRIVTLPNLQSIKTTALITSISKPKRLDKFLPHDLKKIYFKDHHIFSKQEIIKITKQENIKIILSTTKDAIKLEALDLDIEIKIIHLDIKILSSFMNDIYVYLDSFKK